MLLLATLRVYLPAPRFVLASVVPGTESALGKVDLALASTYLDLLNVAAYDFPGPGAGICSHQAQLFAPPNSQHDASQVSCHSIVQYLFSQGVPPEKIVLGIPAYGRSSVDANRQSYGHGAEGGTVEYRYLPRPGATEYVNEALGAAYSIDGDGGFISYDNPQTASMKANYVRSQGLGGLFYLAGTGDLNDSRSLVYSGYTRLHQ